VLESLRAQPVLAKYSNPPAYTINGRRTTLLAMLQQGFRTEWVDFPYEGTSDPGHLALWLDTAKETLESFDATDITWGMGDWGDSLYVGGAFNIPLTEQDIKDINAWLEANPELPPQPIKWRVPANFRADGNVDFVDKV
jgi:hypothetical protein